MEGRRLKKLLASQHLPLIATLLVLAGLFATASAMYDGFFSGRVVANLFGDNATLGIAAVGMTLVILSGGIDLSVGSVLGFTTVFIAVLVQNGITCHRCSPSALRWESAPCSARGWDS